MRNKKYSKKNHTTHLSAMYTPGYDMFGNKAETQLIVLERETAFEQMMDAICQLHKGMEYTFNANCFKGHEEELDAIMAKVAFFMATMAKAKGSAFVTFDLRNAS